MKRIPALPLNWGLQEQTKNRLKKETHQPHLQVSAQQISRFSLPPLPAPNQPFEELRDYWERKIFEHNVKLDIPWIRSQVEYSKEALKDLTLENLDQHYPAEKRAHIYTDG